MIIYISPKLTQITNLLKQKFPKSTIKNIKDYERFNKIHSMAREPHHLAHVSLNVNLHDCSGNSL
jgi:hypothetical protein